MTHAVGFNNAHYLEEQTKAILERMSRFTSKLYLEFGGELFFDYHAARVLPGYDPNVKMKLLQELQGSEVHITHIPSPGDDSGLRRFGINLTTDPNFARKHLLVTQRRTS
ncbi:MAG: DUF1846 domain-containing protein [Candidatus Aminicenantales bacterium]